MEKKPKYEVTFKRVGVFEGWYKSKKWSSEEKAFRESQPQLQFKDINGEIVIFPLRDVKKETMKKIERALGKQVVLTFTQGRDDTKTLGKTTKIYGKIPIFQDFRLVE